jgi:hypothetical protein
MDCEFELLATDGVVGFFNSCEVIEIFGFDETKKPFNIFTLITFEHSNQVEKETLLTDKLQTFLESSSVKWGIIKKIIKVDKALKLHKSLVLNKGYSLNSKVLEVGQLNFSKKQYVQKGNFFTAPQLNYVLKNNFHNGSYLIEGFNEDKSRLDFLFNNPERLDDFNEKIKKIIPIRLGNVSDRIGNVIFQFPINIFHVETSLSQSGESLTIDLSFHQELKEKPQLQIIAEHQFDNSILNFITQGLDGKNTINISTENVVDFKIINKKSNIILYSDNLNAIGNVVTQGTIFTQQNRVFHIDGVKFEVQAGSQSNFNVGQIDKGNFRKWALNRIYDQELNALENSKSFIQYFGGTGEDKKALIDIQSLIQRYGNHGVYIWDPYLSATDIKNTLYHSQYCDVQLKAITGLKQKNNKTEVIQDMVDAFEEDDKDLLLCNLEVRGRVGASGYDFHDRFIIFPLEKAKVWSLGISVNQLGKSHHIFQEVKHSQHILNAFNKLWNELNNEDCLVWKTT